MQKGPVGAQNVWWGLRWGVSASVFFILWATLVRVISGTAPYVDLGVNYGTVITIYAGVGILGGCILGLLRNIVSRWWGAALTGWLIAFIAYSAFSIVLGVPPWRWSTFFWVVWIVISGVVGVTGGLAQRRRAHDRHSS